MLDNALIENCSPTLAGIKTGNLFSVKKPAGEMVDEMRSLNGVLTKKGLRLVPIRSTKEYTLVYLYRPDLLERDMRKSDAAKIMKDKGYHRGNADRLVVQLVDHLKKDDCFPHEIGLFLGYPPVDVKGFMESPCEGFKCVGCWKVYGDEKEARKAFASYEKCTEAYRREMGKGRPLEQMVVDTRGRRNGRDENKKSNRKGA